MKNIKRMLVVLLALAMVLPMAITTSFATAADNWTLFGGKFSPSTDLFLKNRRGQNFTMTENQDGSLTLTQPTSQRYGSGTAVYGITALTNENTTPLDNLSVTLKPGNNFIFTPDTNSISESLGIMWSLEHPITLQELYELPSQNDVATIPYELNVIAMRNGLRGLMKLSRDVTDYQTDPDTGDLVLDETTGEPIVVGTHHEYGDKGLILLVDNPDSNNVGTLIGTRVNIYYFDGDFHDAGDDAYGYRWCFTPRNFTPQTPNGDETGIYSFNERIDATEGVTFEVKPDATLGYKVYVNGKDFSEGEQVGYFPNNVALNWNNANLRNDPNWPLSMTYARADVDLSGLVGLGDGYLTVGTTSVKPAATTYSIDVVSVNGMTAASWAGEANQHLSHTWTTVVDTPSACFTASRKIQKCSVCGAVKNNQFITTWPDNPQNVIRLELRAIDAEYEGINLEAPENAALKAEWRQKYWDALMAWYYTHIEDGLMHELVETVITEPTCMTAGEKSVECSRCGEQFDNVSIRPLGHVWGNFSYNQAGTALVRTCERCETVETVSLPDANATLADYWTATNHDWLYMLNADPENPTYAITDGYNVTTQVLQDGSVQVTDPYTDKKVPLTKAISSFTTPLDGFTATVENILGEVNGMDAGNYSLSFLWTNRPDRFDDAYEYCNYQDKLNNLMQARMGYLWDMYQGGEYDVNITLLDMLFVDNDGDGANDISILEQPGTLGDFIYDVAMYCIIKDGTVYGSGWTPVSIPMDQAISVALAYDGEDLTFTFNNNVVVEDEDVLHVELPETDEYNFGIASYGVTTSDYTGTGASTALTTTPTVASTDFIIRSICGEQPATFTGTGHEAYVPAGCEHEWGDWIYGANTAWTSGTRTRTCALCGETETENIEAQGVVWGVDNYDFIIYNAKTINAIRYAPGVHTTSNSIRNDPDMRSLSAAVIAANTDENGVLRYTMPNGGIYSFWVRYDNGTSGGWSQIVNNDGNGVDMTHMTPEISYKFGLNVTLSNLYGVKDFFIAKGTWETYRDTANNKIVQITSAKIAGAHDYKYLIANDKLSQDNNYTIWVRFDDANRAGQCIHFSLPTPQPEYTQNGLQTTVTGLRYTNGDYHDDIKVIRSAPGQWTTASQVKNAPNNRNYTDKYVIKGADSYTIQYKDDGWYTIAVDYVGGYCKIFQYYVQHLEPTVSWGADGHSVTFGNLDSLSVLRYAPGKVSIASNFKQTPGNQFKKLADAVNGEITITGLSGKWSFLVQYTELSAYIITSHQFDD